MKYSILIWLLVFCSTGVYTQEESYRERKIRLLDSPSPFQKEIDGEFPERIVFQDDFVVVLNSIAPQAPVHVLIIPRKRIPTINDLTEADSTIVAHMFMAARRVAEDKGVAESGYRLAINTNEDAGQSAFHIHMHLLGGMKTGPMVDQRWRNQGPKPGGSYQRAMTKVKDLYAAYFSAWIQGDSAALLRQMTPDATIMPAGLPTVTGTEAIRRHWFPDDGSVTTVTKFDHTLDEIRLDGNMAYIRGTSSLSFRYEKDGETTEINNINHNRIMIFERQDDDSWLITCNVWTAML